MEQGDVITYSLSDKKGRQVWLNKLRNPDFYIQAGTGAKNGHYEVLVRKDNTVQISAQETIISFSIGSLDIRRIYRINAQSASIACETYLKGQVEGIAGGNRPMPLTKKTLNLLMT
ncbi:hypothetical protein [Pedobacter sp. P26]|uniref:hypothetical protein n=1 Tax=Pedobacter sp. P26 TaxID=3423956 RepID=UPI003D6794FF